jgi:hypothetical protein
VDAHTELYNSFFATNEQSVIIVDICLSELGDVMGEGRTVDLTVTVPSLLDACIQVMNERLGYNGSHCVDNIFSWCYAFREYISCHVRAQTYCDVFGRMPPLLCNRKLNTYMDTLASKYWCVLCFRHVPRIF